uniref:Solute carrier family 35 member F2 n=1 Tax=Podarcis muralis TaxID=64176 RepID=A0A670HL47_PODMU
TRSFCWAGVGKPWAFRCGQLAQWSAMVLLTHIVKTLFLGQILSLFICGTAVTSQYLADKYQVNTPMLQSFINYCLLFLVYTMILAFRKDDDNLWQILRRKWWKYILLGLVDVEANYSIVKAYQYTTLTSVQLLDCFGIPVLMALSWFILRARYKLIHFIAVAVCLLGVGTMVGADVLAERHNGEEFLLRGNNNHVLLFSYFIGQEITFQICCGVQSPRVISIILGLQTKPVLFYSEGELPVSYLVVGEAGIINEILQ